MQSEKCEDCPELATYICVCAEEHLCEECLVEHTKENTSLKHRIVSLYHPLLSLFEDSGNESDEEDMDRIENQIKLLEDFRNNCVGLIDEKIKNINENETPALPVSKSVAYVPLNMHASYTSIREDLSVRESKFSIQKSFDQLYTPGSIYRSHNRPSSFESFSYKVLICGDFKVGKSCIIESFKHIHEDVNENSVLVFRSVQCENLKVNLEVFEERGIDGCEGCLGALVVFDLTNKSSLKEAKDLIARLEKNALVLGVIILVGTRLDLVVSNQNKRVASFTAIQSFATNRGLLYDEICAVNYNHVQELFMRLVRELYKKSKKSGF